MDTIHNRDGAKHLKRCIVFTDPHCGSEHCVRPTCTCALHHMFGIISKIVHLCSCIVCHNGELILHILLATGYDNIYLKATDMYTRICNARLKYYKISIIMTVMR